MYTFSTTRDARLRRRSAAICAICLGFLFTIAPHARGELMFFDGNPNGYMPALHDAGLRQRNVLFNSSGQSPPALTVEGTLNGSSNERVMIGSTTLINASGGQAPGISGATGDFYDADFAPHSDNEGVTFRSLSFNIDANGNDSGNFAVELRDSTEDFSVQLLDANGDPLLNSDGDPVEHLFSVSNGNTFFGVISTDETPFYGVSLSSSLALDRITQIRATLADASGLPTEPSIHTPEPTSVLIWMALAAMAGFYWRKRRHCAS